MIRRLLYLQLFVALAFFAGVPVKGGAVGSTTPRQPLAYIENKGQWDSDVLFLARTPGLDVWITRTGVMYDAFSIQRIAGNKTAVRKRGSAVYMEFANSSAAAVPSGRQQISTRYSYLTDKGSAKEVHLFSEAVVKEVYSGIDMVFYFDAGTPRYDCVVQPGADYSKISLVMHGADSISIDNNGALAFHTPSGAITQRGLTAYQIVNGAKRTIPCSFVVKNSSSTQPEVGFQMGDYDASLPVVIDPLVYSAFLGGTDVDEMVDIAVDQGGNAYVVGTTMSPDFPHTPGAYDMVWSDRDIVLTKLNFSGVEIVFSTFLGGSREERAAGLVRDKNGYLYILGETQSNDIPRVGRTYSYSLPPAGSNVFVVKVNGAGNDVQYVTMIGGDGDDRPAGIAVDDQSNVYITGTASTGPFPTYPISNEVSKGGTEAFVFSLNISGVWRYSTTISGSNNDEGTAIAMDPRGTHFWIGGVTDSKDLPTTDGRTYQGTGTFYMFFARYRTTGERLLVSYAGIGTARATSVAVDALGDAFLAGYTDGSFELPVPTIQPQYDKGEPVRGEAILLKIEPLAMSSRITYSTYLGSDYDDIINDIVVDRFGAVIMVGSTTQQGEKDSLFYDPKPDVPRSVRREGFIAVLTPGERLLNYTTYIGGSDDDECKAVVVTRDSVIYVVGNTNSQDLPVSLGSPEYKGNQDGMIIKAEYIPKFYFADENRVIDFGTVYAGDTKELTISILGTGLSAAELEKMTFLGGTVFSSNLVVPAIIPNGTPAGELPITLAFKPLTPGVFADTIVFEIRFLKRTLRVFLRGVSIDRPVPVLALEPDTLRIGKVFTGEHGQGFLSLTNKGVVPGQVSNITISSAAGLSYTGTTTLTLGVDGVGSLRIDFDPTTAGATSALVKVYVERSTTPLVAVVLAEGVDRPKPNVYLETYDINVGKVQIGHTKKVAVVVSNTGQTSATLSVEEASDPFEASLDATDIKPSSSVLLNVEFTPTEVGSTTAQIALKIEELSTTLVLTARGEGVLPMAVASRDTVDFGDVLTSSTAHARVILRNTGIDTFRVASIGAIAKGFSRSAGVPANVAVAGELPIDIDFTPSALGAVEELLTISVDYLPEPVTVVLRGTGVQDDAGPRGIVVRPDTLDYDAVFIASTATKSFIISNTSTTQSVHIQSISIVQQPGRTDFTVATVRNFPYSIGPGAEDIIIVNFSPVTTGSVEAQARVVSTLNTVSVVLLGIGEKAPVPAPDTVRIIMPDIKAKLGEYTELQLTLADPEQSRNTLQSAGITGFNAVLRWNASVMVPVAGHTPGTVIAGVREVPISGSFSSSTGAVFYRIPVRVLLGDAEYTSIRIVDMVLQPESSAPPKVVADRSDTARLSITDVWHDGDGPRLINPDARPLGLRLSPNPFSDASVLSVEHANAQSSLVIYNLIGEAIVDLSSNLTGSDLVEIPLSRSMFPNGGVYYCRLVSGGNTVVRTIILRSQQQP